MPVMKGTEYGKFGRSGRKLRMDLMEGGSKERREGVEERGRAERGGRDRDREKTKAFNMSIRWVNYCCLCQNQDNRGRCVLSFLGTWSMCRLHRALQTWCCKDGSGLRTETWNWLSMGGNCNQRV